MNDRVGMGAMGLWWLIVLVIVVTGVAVAARVRALRARDRPSVAGAAAPELGGRTEARRLLDDRYARGELGTEEYRERVITLDELR